MPKLTEERLLVCPSLVPIRVLGRLAAVGIHTTAQVHDHIRNGNLRRLKGIGPAWERRIVSYYTEERDD